MDKIWLDQYPNSVPHSINLNEFTSLVDLFEKCCEKYKDRPAVRCNDRTLTYQELNRLSSQFAAFLQNELGLQKGDRVGIMLPNTLQYFIAIFGILRAGLIGVNINPLYTGPELAKLLTISGTKTIIIVNTSLLVLKKALNKTSITNIIATKIDDFDQLQKKHYKDRAKFLLYRAYFTVAKKNFYSFNQATKMGSKATLHKVKMTHDDIAFLQTTSGTTGESKCAILLHKNILANVLSSIAWFSPVLSAENKEIVITPMPLYHVLALITNCFGFVLLGGLNILITNPRDMNKLITLIKSEKFTAIIAVNTFVKSLLAHKDFNQLDVSRLRLTISAGSILEEKAAQDWFKLTNCVITNQYGETETGPVSITPQYNKTFSGSIGLPLPSVDISIRDDDNNEIPIGEIGELCIQGPCITPGYWQNEQATAATFTPDGWLRSGDLIKLDEKGNLYFIARKKEVIKVSGFSVSPAEIEAVIASHPDVFEVAVIGIPDEHMGQIPKAFVVSKNTSLTSEDLIKHCRQSLTGYKIPRAIEFRTELPKSSMGKVLKRNLLP